jgi:hypothetical protein
LTICISPCLQALADITTTLLNTSPFELNRRLFQKCCSQMQRSTTSTGAELLLRPNTKDLLTLVKECLQSVLHNPAVMGAAQQPAVWMPDKASILASTAECEHRVQECLERAVDVALS